ncbi:MAG: divergent polysaccharide deacetylase family protein [Pseudorhodoplanes sp.]
MTADDLNVPLGQTKPKKSRFTLPVTAPQIVAGLLGGVVLIFALWIVLVDDPTGGEPMAAARLAPSSLVSEAGKPAAPPVSVVSGQPPRQDAATGTVAGPSQTITVIDGSSGKRQEFTVPAPGAAADPKKGASLDQRLFEQSRHGPIPRIAPDGARPSEVYARPAPAASPDAPRVALIVSGLGIGARGTADAFARLPKPVTFALAPYAGDVEHLAERARNDGRETLLQVPMEPFDYPDNDPGPQTLLTSLGAEQNVDRLQWLMARFPGYVGIMNFMGARFTASEQSFAPILRETAKRGLIYIDDGSSPRSMASQMAGANAMPFVKADVTLDAAPTPAEIDRALARLEAIARERGSAVGVTSALPVAIEHAAKWAKAAAARGVVLVPISALTAKPRSS